MHDRAPSPRSLVGRSAPGRHGHRGHLLDHAVLDRPVPGSRRILLDPPNGSISVHPSGPPEGGLPSRVHALHRRGPRPIHYVGAPQALTGAPGGWRPRQGPARDRQDRLAGDWRRTRLVPPASAVGRPSSSSGSSGSGDPGRLVADELRAGLVSGAGRTRSPALLTLNADARQSSAAMSTPGARRASAHADRPGAIAPRRDLGLGHPATSVAHVVGLRSHPLIAAGSMDR